MPPSKREKNEGTTLFDGALKECISIGLLVDNNGSIETSEFVNNAQKADFSELICDLLFDLENAERCNHTKFLNSLAWIMTLDPCEPLGFKNTITRQLTNSLGVNKSQTEIYSNISSLQNLYYWAAFLGFGENIGGTASNQGVRLFMPNPCSVIERNLSKIFQDKQSMRIGAFIKNLSDIIPVFDKGIIRNQIEVLLPDEAKIKSDNISKTLSYALKQLEFKKVITMDQQADANKFILNFGVATHNEPVSDIRRNS